MMKLRLRKVKPQAQIHIRPKSRASSATFCCCPSFSTGLSPHSLINADFCVASVCVAFGAVLGKVSPIQLLIMTFFQVTLFAVNEFILLNLLKVSRAQNGDEVVGVLWGTAGYGEIDSWGDMPAWRVT